MRTSGGSTSWVELRTQMPPTTGVHEQHDSETLIRHEGIVFTLSRVVRILPLRLELR